MGDTKRRLIDDEQRGFRSVGDRHACPRCVDEEALARFVHDNADSATCSYCGATSSMGHIALSTDILFEAIAQGLEAEYDDALNELPWEGGWVFEPMDASDVLEEAGCHIASMQLREDIVHAFDDREWCQRDFFRLPKDRALLLSWKRFAQQVKHRSRYFFLSRNDDQTEETFDPDVLSSADTLAAIGRAINEVGLVRCFPASTKWYRARTHNLDDEPVEPVGAAGLGPVPEDRAPANRMSPAGIPMFYGAREADTAISEVIAVPQNSAHPLVTIGTFVTARTTRLVDLTDLPPVPSLFDEARRHLRAPVRFMRAFSEQLSQPISRDDVEHIEYVPSQVATEWFRDVFIANGRTRVDGLVYRSARRAAGACCVMFVGPDAVCDACPGWQDDAGKLLALESAETRRRPS